MRGPTPLDEAMAQGSYGHEAMRRGFEGARVALQVLQREAEEKGRSDTTALAKVALNVMGVVLTWQEHGRAFIGCDEASLAILEAIERGLDPAK